MTPAEVGRSYDAITRNWESPEHPLGGLEAHRRRALQFCTSRRHALDVGCGCNGRLFDLLRGEGFALCGVDVSEQMIAAARRRDPDIELHLADVRTWNPPRSFDFITGWDSLWHVPLADQEHVLRKLCDALEPGGVLIFTLGGLDAPGEVRDASMGVPMYHGTLGIPRTLALLSESGCVCRHLEYDQWPQPHVYVIAQKA